MRTTRFATACLLVFALVGCGSDPQTVMPDVTGTTLDVAKIAIQDAGFSGDVDVQGGGLLGVVIESNWTVCEQSPAAGAAVTGKPQLTVDRSCGDDAGAAPSAEPSPTPEQTQAAAAAYVYEGPKYEVVTVDKGVGLSVLDQYWALTDKLDYSTDAYKDQVKLIVADVARTAGTAEILVQVVTDPEIVEAESLATGPAFTNSHDRAYVSAIEASDWVASYSGGIDYDTGELSASTNAYEVLWWPYGVSATEKWKPEIAG